MTDMYFTRFEAEFEPVAALMRHYSHVPMDVAHGCLARLSEKINEDRVLTAASNFKFCRRFGQQVIPLFYPS